MKFLAILLAALCFAVPADAANKKKNPKKEAREKLKEARAKEREMIKDFLEPKDRNKDGSLTREEFLSDETDKEEAGKRFDEANKNGDRALSRAEISEMIGAGEEVKKLKQAAKDKKK